MYVMPAGGMFSTVHETDNDGLCATTYYSLFVFLLDTFHENVYEIYSLQKIPDICDE